MFTIYHNNKSLNMDFSDVVTASNEAYWLAIACHPQCDPKRHRVTPAPTHVFEVLDDCGRPRSRFDAAKADEYEDLFPMSPTDWVDHGWDL